MPAHTYTTLCLERDAVGGILCAAVCFYELCMGHANDQNWVVVWGKMQKVRLKW